MQSRQISLEKYVRPLIWSVLAAIALYGISVVSGDYAAITSAGSRLGLKAWAAILALSLINYVIRFIRWHFYLRQFSYRVPLFTNFACYVGGFAFTTTPGKAGEIIRSVYLARFNVSYIHSIAAFFVERFVDIIAMVLLALAATTAFPAYKLPVLAMSVVILAALRFVHGRSAQRLLEWLAKKLSSEMLRITTNRIRDLLQSASRLLRSGPLYGGLALGLLAWGAEGVAFHIILSEMDVAKPILLGVGIYSISVLVGAISFIPGGLGTTEATMIALLKLIGIDLPTAMAATLICRLVTLWFAVVLGIGFLGLLQLKMNLSESPDENLKEAES